jgi:hypothetical protein
LLYLPYLFPVSHFLNSCILKDTVARCWWLTPVILATQEAEIRRIIVQSQPRQTVHETLAQKKKKTHHKKRAGRVAQTPVPQ